MGIDHRQFNIRNHLGQYLCPACGLPGYFEGQSYIESGGLIATGICPCCSFEPGFNDDPGASVTAEKTVAASILKHRANWVATGMPWRGSGGVEAPEGWEAQVQLVQLAHFAPAGIKP